MAETQKGTAADNSGGNEITVETAGRLLKISVRHVQRLAKQGWIRRPYTVVGVVHGYIDWRDQSDKQRTHNASANRVNAVRAADMEFKFAALKREYIKTDTAIAIIDEIFGPLRADLEGLPAAASREIPLRRKMEGLIAGILEGAAKRADATLAAVSEGGDNPAPGRENIARRLGATKSDLPGGVGRPRSKKSRADAVHDPD